MTLITFKLISVIIQIQHLQLMRDKAIVMSVAQSCPILCDPMAHPRNSLGKNTGVGNHSLLQGIILTRG